MTSQTLYIKNMVCHRCIQVVGEELTKLGIETVDIQLGVVKTAHPLSADQLRLVKEMLQRRGFELLETNQSKWIEQIKTAIIELVHHPDIRANQNVSDYLEKRVGRDYSYLSHLFSSVENLTIERYMILQKIEKIKELLIYDELTLSEIAYRLDYSSVQYLSGQFRKVTGLSPSEFKRLSNHHRRPLDQINIQ